MISVNAVKPAEVQKSWKKINEERKELKKQRKQEKLFKEIEKKQNIEKQNQDKALEALDRLAEIKAEPSTISIAVPGSILENAQSVELRTYVAGQIARAACIFKVNEVIVFDDIGLATARETKRNYDIDDDNADENMSHTVRSSCLQLARILQYLECPQYLRKFFFPLHKDLKYSGLLNPLDAPHHLRQQNIFRYREGIVTEKKAKPGQSYVNVGLLNDILVKKALTPGLRVTVKLDNDCENFRKQRGIIVSPDEPRRETGVYWGYTVRIAHSISDIFTKSPYKGGYDITIGTSDRGANIQDVPSKSLQFNHMLLVFGGLQGLESALSNDDKLQIDDPQLLFDHYINVLPKQGSRTIRTEEAILIAMAAIQEKLNPKTIDIEEEKITEALPRSEDTGGIIPRPGDTKLAKKRKHQEVKSDAISNKQENLGEPLIIRENQMKRNLFDKKTENNKLNINNDNVDIKNEQGEKSVKENLFKKEDNVSDSRMKLDVTDDDVDFEIVPVDKRTRHNPFKKTEKNSHSHTKKSKVKADDVYFQVVALDKTDIRKNSSSANEDLSRFD